MKSRSSILKLHRSILITALASSSIFSSFIPAFADQNSPIPTVLIENQATASFIDSADGSTQDIVSEKVQVTVAEVAGISANGAGINGTVYRTNVVYFDFLVKNAGNDPTQLFLPAAPSSATIDGVALPASSIGQLQVINYNDTTTTTAISVNNLVNATSGSATGSLTGLPNGGSVPAGGYIKVRVPVTVPPNANVGDIISVTLGNTNTTQGNVNVPYIAGAAGTGTNDLYTQDNPNGTPANEAAGIPINGDAVNHQQEASAVQTIAVVAPPNISISGTIWNDANGSGSATFTGINNGVEAGANVTPAITAILVDGAGKVVANAPVLSDGTYTFTNIPGVQNGLYVMLSNTTGVVGTATPAPSVPANWANTSPLTYLALPFAIGIADVTGKDFGLDQLPETSAVNALSQANPPGTTKYQVPTLIGTDPEDGALGGGKTFMITALPLASQGILYYDNVAVLAGATIVNYDPIKLTFDPVDGVVNMSFSYASVDAAGKVDLSPAAATMSFSATPVGIRGTVWSDRDSSAAGTFSNIQTGAEVGTDAVFGTTTVPVNAILINTTTGLVIGTQLVEANGVYSFGTVPANTDVKVILSSTAGTVGSAPPTATVPTGWVGTSPKESAIFNTGLYSSTGKDFGIRQKAKLVLYKLITKINGSTTNPNDGTNLTIVTTDGFNNVGNWPANYLVGRTDAGKVQPGDTIEYTVYFLNNQGTAATSVKICDPIRGVQDYMSGTLKLRMGNAASDTALSDSPDLLDRANYYPSNSTPTGCNAGAATSTGVDKGGIAINITGSTTTNQAALTGVPGATGAGIPTTSYGLFRFTTKVEQ